MFSGVSPNPYFIQSPGLQNDLGLRSDLSLVYSHQAYDECVCYFLLYWKLSLARYLMWLDYAILLLYVLHDVGKVLDLKWPLSFYMDPIGLYFYSNQ